MIHPSAVVDPKADIDSSADVGPLCVVEAGVRIGARTRLLAHAVVLGDTTLGSDNEVHPGAVLGGTPQDLAFDGQPSAVRIGDRNVFREGSTVHRGTKPGTVTTIGNDNYVMQNAHVGHNAVVGNHAIVAGGALLSGYVELGDRGFVSGNCTVHQFVKIGRLALLRGLSRTSRNVPPFCIMDGTHTVRTLNLVGLRRAGFASDDIRALNRVFRALFLEHANLREGLEAATPLATTPAAKELLAFCQDSDRPLCTGPR